MADSEAANGIEAATPGQRLFVAIELPDAVLDSIGEKTAACRRDVPQVRSSIRWVRRANLHITLSFIGRAGPAAVSEISDALASAAAATSPFELGVGGAGAFPDLRRPSVLWAGLTTGGTALASLAHEVRAALASIGMTHDQKRFRGHITIGRLPDPVDIADVVSCLTDHDYGHFTVREVTLFESLTGGESSRYLPIQRHELATA